MNPSENTKTPVEVDVQRLPASPAGNRLVDVSELQKAAHSDLVTEWLGGDPASLGFLRCTYDLSSFEGVAQVSKFQSDSIHDNSKLDGKEFVITGIALTSYQDTDNITGEVRNIPRLCMGVRDGTHLVFCGMIALKSGLFIMAGVKAEDWSRGVRIRIHEVQVKRGNAGHNFELLGFADKK